jgi:hypothetical protein
MKNAIAQAVSELRKMNPPAPAEPFLRIVLSREPRFLPLEPFRGPASAEQENFSRLLPLFDFVFGTAHFPKSGKPARYGLAEEQAPPTFWGQMRWPFRGLS